MSLYYVGYRALKRSDEYAVLSRQAVDAGRVDMATAYARCARELWLEADAAACSLGDDWHEQLREMFDGE